MQNRLTMTVVSKEHASDASHDTAGSLGKAAMPCKRRCKSHESDTEALNDYELERHGLKRIKANKEMLVSLGIENPLPKLHRCRGRKRSSTGSADDITHVFANCKHHSYLSEEDGYGEPESE